MESSAYAVRELENRRATRDWRVLKPEQKEPVLAAIAAGKSVDEVAQEFHIDRSRIYGYLKHHKIPYPFMENRKAEIRAQCVRIQELLAQGWNPIRIIDELNITRSTLNKRLKTIGIHDPTAYRYVARMNSAKAATNRRLAGLNRTEPFAPWTVRPIDRTNEPPSKQVGHNDLERDHCRYLHGDPKDRAHHFCGHQVKPGKVYCDFHYSICYDTSGLDSGELDEALAAAVGVR
jgi:DNA-binding CsgD family transcriptional regulator